MVEDRGIGGESGYRQVVNIVLKRTVVQQLAGNVVEPETLARVVKQSRRFHGVPSLVVDRRSGVLTLMHYPLWFFRLASPKAATPTNAARVVITWMGMRAISSLN